MSDGRRNREGPRKRLFVAVQTGFVVRRASVIVVSIAAGIIVGAVLGPMYGSGYCEIEAA